MNKKQQLEFIENLCEAGAESVLQKGYNWFQDVLTPSLQLISEQQADQRPLLGEAWLIAGEIHELLNAPNQAITCYHISLFFNPTSVDTHRWKALVHEQLGEYLEATKHIELALKYSEEGEELMVDRQRIQDCIVYDKAPDFEAGNLLWGYNELLAEGKFGKVIKGIKKLKTEDIELLHCLYRAYGGKKNTAKGEKIWQRILKIDAEAILGELDLFYWG